MKRINILLAGLLLTFSLFALSPAASAINIFQPCDGKAKNTDVCQDVSQQKKNGGNPIIRGLSITISILAFIIGIAAVIVIIVAGLRMATASGDPKGFTAARNAIIYALVGIVIAILARTLVVFVIDKI